MSRFEDSKDACVVPSTEQTILKKKKILKASNFLANIEKFRTVLSYAALGATEVRHFPPRKIQFESQICFY